MTETPPVDPTAPDSATPTDPPADAPVDPPVDPPADPPAAKKAAKKAPAKKAAAAPPKPERKSNSLYLPALPEGFHYTNITATGPDGATVNIGPNGDKAHLAIDGANISKSGDYDDMDAAIKAGAKAAKAMADVAKREAELAALRQEAFDF